MLTKAKHSIAKHNPPYGVMIIILLATCDVRLPADTLVINQGVQIDQTSIAQIDHARELLDACVVGKAPLVAPQGDALP